MSHIEASPYTLFDPLAAVRWNMNKRYLFDLERWGVPIIPTHLASDTAAGTFRQWLADQCAQTLVLKPTIGLGGSHSCRTPLAELNLALTTLKASQPQQEYLIQPFIESVVTEGEWSFVYFNGQLSHVLLKQPAPSDYRVQGIYGGTVQSVEPLAHDLRRAEAIIAKLPFDILYARLDCVRVGGQLAVIEVELIEPSFSFRLVPESIVHLAHAIRAKLAR
jgi:glutathione synthase/RimK-type ligase-like ATP-grasp enzyme